jgi:transglutaminase-like putative cysteine protease
MEGLTYRIQHTTTYHYASPVRVCHNLVMLSPRNDAYTKVLNHRLQIRPTSPTMRKREDYFGNVFYAFSIEESHRQLVIISTARVRVIERVISDDMMPWNFVREQVATQSDPRWLEACRFAYNSPRIQVAREFAEYATPSFNHGRDIVEASMELSSRIHRDFKYDVAATQVDTTTMEAFKLRRGVCQDFAHIQIACLRSLGICARYVSGYLRTLPPPGKERLIGADQSHAWVSVYCGIEKGWVDFDPTNNCLANVNHVPIAWGRDYSDVSPMRGVFLGGGEHRMDVSVDVCPVEGS